MCNYTNSCQSDDIFSDPMRYQGEFASRLVECNGCNSSWTEILQTNEKIGECPQCLSIDVETDICNDNDDYISPDQNECYRCGHTWTLNYHFSYIKKD